MTNPLNSQPTSDSVQSAPDTPQKSSRYRTLMFQMTALGLTIISAIAGTSLARWLRPKSAAAEGDTRPAIKAEAFPAKARLFQGWRQPDLVLVLTGQMNGYLLPCGCSRPQYGGLERRYNLLQMMKAAGWPVAAVDLGDIPQKHGPADLPNQQGIIKYRYAMQALKEMNYSAVGFGEYEVNLGLLNTLAEYALQFPKPRVISANLLDAEKEYPEMTKPLQILDPIKDIRIGVTSVTGPAVATRIKEMTKGTNPIRFQRTPDALDAMLKTMGEKKVDLPILLYQGPMTRNAMKRPPTEAVACAEAYPQFPIVVCLSDEDEPPSRPVEVDVKGGKNLIISIGRKGKFVGVVGIYKTGKAERPFEFRYERVELGEEFVTAAGKEKGHPIADLMDAYTRELKNQNYLEKYGQVRHLIQVMPEVKGLRKPGKAEYAGSQRCKSCHPNAYNIWKKTPHSHAYQTLVDATHPTNRQYDPECIVCHTVGFGIVSGYVNETKTPKLKDVGCESCHGPSSVHADNPNDVDWHKRINPWKYLPANKQEAAMDMMCQKCHDIDNDVTWIHNGFKKKWPKIAHPTPRD